MGKWKTRDVHQRRMDQIVSTIDTSLSYLKNFCEVYEEAHPKLAEAAEQIASILIIAQDGTRSLKVSF